MSYCDSNIINTAPNCNNLYPKNNNLNNDDFHQCINEFNQQQHQDIYSSRLNSVESQTQENSINAFNDGIDLNNVSSTISSGSNIENRSNLNIISPENNINHIKLLNKFTQEDINILKQLLIVGEKHKWKQITKVLNQSHKINTNCQSDVKDEQNKGCIQNTTKNISPTFVIKQYQHLLGLPNNTLYFGHLGSSLPYVVSSNGWKDIKDIAYHHNFNDDNK